MGFLHIHKWSEPDNRVQTCTKCNKKEKVECAHSWSTMERYTAQYVWGGGEVFVFLKECTTCGEVKKFTV